MLCFFLFTFSLNGINEVFFLGVDYYVVVHGCNRFDMMGAGKPDEAYGVRDFKARFGGEQVEYGRFLYIRKSLLYWIGKLGVKFLKKR